MRISDWSSDVCSSDLDAMRMAQVRDLLAGQGWWDLTQYRVNPADGGVLMHWSRIVDAPIAGGILLLRPLFGQPLAEQMVMAIRSEERRVGKECVSQCRSRWSPDH